MTYGPLTLSATCHDCYARLFAGLRVQWQGSFGLKDQTFWTPFGTPYGQLNALRAEVFGQLDVNAQIELSATIEASWADTVQLMSNLVFLFFVCASFQACSLSVPCSSLSS